jgi:PRTRC genetic system ThiF family protein
MQTPARFDPPQMIREVVLVGCGGTGAQLARSLCRIVYDLKCRRKHAPALKFVDPDRVESRNIGRQLYTTADVGDFKAAVLARRFNCSLGLDITWHNEPFDAERHADQASLVCGAVDNHLARRALAQHRGLWLDCGNHLDSGQIVLGNTNDPALVRRSIQTGTYHYLPNAALLFPALLEPEPPSVPQPAASCAQLVETGDQALLINDLIATVAAQYLYKLLNHEPVSTFVSFCDTATLNVKSIPISAENLTAYLS